MKKNIKDYILLIIGGSFISLAISAFLVPSNIGTGGVTGIALSLNKLFGFRLGLLTLSFNIPLFIFGYKLIGQKFTIRSGFVVFIMSMLIDYLTLNFNFLPFEDVLLATIYCGILFGIGNALVFMGGGSSGGFDIIAKIIVRKHQGLQLSSTLLVQDIIVFILIAYALGINSVLYAFVMSFVRAKTIDTVQEGVSSSKQCVIICEAYEEIAGEIQKKLVRGVTILEAVGGYSNKRKKFIYVVIQKNQLTTLKKIVKAIDPEAFVSVSSVTNVVGNYRQSVSVS
jgi:uncharacterized membrane-anchored protein YitT (DUF2179 family)